ncbi:MAG: nucleotidyl transferase AbiEii/AbiGii toxin family protein [Patulibacter sp.]|nr:nucleotidyl transferase AbiEii/AbiGii toxin family protein [Patulibacter sp.]
MADVNGKPRNRDGYTPEDLLQVRSTCLTVAATLGGHLGQMCVVGGLTPTLLIDERLGPDPETDAGHAGTNDLDVAMTVALLDDHGYEEVSTRLRQEGFGPDTNERGNPTPQRWKLKGRNVTIDFLLPPIEEGQPAGRVQPLESDFAALIVAGLDLAAHERVPVELSGHTLGGERITREVPVCGPGAFVALKALAFADRVEPKDAYDLVYVLRRWPQGTADIAARLVSHANREDTTVRKALQCLANDFPDPSHVGPLRAAEFDTLRAEDLDAAAADAHGYVDDLLRACDRRGLAVEA